MSAKLINILRKKAYDFAMDENPDKAREALAQIKILEDQMKESAQKKIGIETVTTADTLTERPVLDLVAQRLQKEQELLKVQDNRAKAIKDKFNNPNYETYKKMSRFDPNHSTWEDYIKDIQSEAIRETNIMKDSPNYKYLTTDAQLKIARENMVKEAQDDFLKRQMFLDFGGFGDEFLPDNLKKMENFSAYADNVINEFKSGERVLPYKAKDGLIYNNADQINKVKQAEKLELEQLRQEKILQDRANNIARQRKMAESGSDDPTRNPLFSKDGSGFTGYKNKVFNRLRRGVYIKRDVNGQPVLNEKGEVQFLDWDKNSDYNEIRIQQDKDMKTPPGVKKLIYIEPKIPNLEKGHELMKNKRLDMFFKDDTKNLKQISYPTFFTTEPRNKIHRRLEEDLVEVLDQIKNLSSTLLRSKESNVILKQLKNTKDMIVQDMKILGLESRILNEKTGKFRAYGKAFYEPGQLVTSLNGIKKFNYLGNKEFDIRIGKDGKPTDLNRNIKNVDGDFVLPDGFEDGGFASFEEVLEYNNG
jgi:hypothetical protein